MVVDSTDRARLETTKEELFRMLAHEDLVKANLLIYANKQDVKGKFRKREGDGRKQEEFKEVER